MSPEPKKMSALSSAPAAVRMRRYSKRRRTTTRPGHYLICLKCNQHSTTGSEKGRPSEPRQIDPLMLLNRSKSQFAFQRQMNGG